MGYVDDIRHRYTECCRNLTQNGNAGISLTFFHLNQHSLADTRASRKLIKREFQAFSMIFMAGIDPVVDLYNAVSIHYAIPVGGENFSNYDGQPRLTIAQGTERFDTMKEGVAAEECPEAGEVIWRDEAGVTCRRWNWRQGVRTRLSAEATQMWFILESLPEMPLAMLHEAADELIRGIEMMMPGARTEKTLIGFDIA